MFFLYSDNNSSLKWSLPKLILRVVWGYFVKPLCLHSLAQYILVPIPCADYDLLWLRHVVKYMKIMHFIHLNSNQGVVTFMKKQDFQWLSHMQDESFGVKRLHAMESDLVKVKNSKEMV